ncbi:uncharacterized protein BDZ99DRAFT_462594 [Mytilinidion resinicola]|uniref:Uncharacterized protein n=1 Tax=Mytilinidion resinicola TaxID=574789 RepID=A0A6A6YQ11_9PEZI|nr:uncharacterized protein BDZ99DRAFT_462594 [Mytilinidion resinicola]KAF2809967.1 hypothetical protein BDZ99DRAFT_462594 [Mytilinidion resinicola]
MPPNSTYCRNLYSIPHTNPGSAIWGFAIPWLTALCFALAAISSASDAAYLALVADDSPCKEERQPPVPSSTAKTIAAIATSVALLPAVLTYANQILGLLELDACRSPAAREH